MRRILALASLTALAGCPKNMMQGGPDMAAPAIMTYAEFLTAYAQASCQAAVSCHFIAAGSESACVAAGTDAAANSFDTAGAISSGLIKFDAMSAQMCVEAQAALPCLRGQSAPTVCGKVLSGTVAAGAACHSNGECAAPTTNAGICQDAKHNPVADGCAGICVGEAQANGDCTVANCATGLYCKTSGATPTCAAVGAVGAACDAGSGSSQCQNGLICQPDLTYNTGTCQMPGSVGDRCFLSNPTGFVLNIGRGNCKPMLICDGTLQKPVCAAAKQSGDACGTDDACDSMLLCVGISYNFGGGVASNGTCKPPAMADQACTDFSACADDLFCQATNADFGSEGTCKPKPLLNGACDPADDQCYQGYCERTSKTCKDYLGAGGSCDADPNASPSQCAAGSLTCSTGPGDGGTMPPKCVLQCM
jgi:hypothetical protein